MRGDVAVCITAYNEAETIGTLLYETSHYRRIVVDDGSSDMTGRIALDAGARVIWHRERMGIGPSLLFAWREALDEGAEYVVQLDAGGSHAPTSIPRLLSVFEDVPDVQMVIGSRFMPGGRHVGNAKRRLLSHLAAAACNYASVVQYTDWTSGYRAFRAATVDRLLAHEYHAKGHAWQIEVLWNAMQEHMLVAEVPISYTCTGSTLNWRGMGEAFGVWRRLLRSG